jgi:hypothetical protein
VRAREPPERAQSEVDVAISLVLAGVAVTIPLGRLDGAEGAAISAPFWAGTASVAFRLLREPALPVGLGIGPRSRLAPVSTAFETGP